MNGGGINHLPLVQGIKESYISWRVAKEAKNWRTMEDAFKSISKHARAVERTKAYYEPRYKDITTINAIYSQPRVNNEYTRSKDNNWPNNIKQEANETNKALECYYCNKPHYISNCMKFKANKDKYKLKAQQVWNKYLERIRQGAQKMSINK